MPMEHDVSYSELRGPLNAVLRPRAPGDTVVLSNLEPGSVVTPRGAGVRLRFVGRGRESYRIDGRGVHLDEEHVMIVQQDIDEEVAIPKSDRSGTLGLCVLFATQSRDLPWLAGPLVFNAACTPIGPLMKEYMKILSRPASPKQQLADAIANRLRMAMPSVTRAVMEQAAAMSAAKPATRYEMVRRANLAQAYLHSVLDRAVNLGELSRTVGTSPFQLLRSFQGCFGQSPAEYHRRLRLEQVLNEAKRRGISIAAAAQDFGFADGSSFSHAYRRAFGRPPVWSKSGV